MERLRQIARSISSGIAAALTDVLLAFLSALVPAAIVPLIFLWILNEEQDARGVIVVAVLVWIIAALGALFRDWMPLRPHQNVTIVHTPVKIYDQDGEAYTVEKELGSTQQAAE
jgi:hypothetical protein